MLKHKSTEHEHISSSNKRVEMFAEAGSGTVLQKRNTFLFFSPLLQLHLCPLPDFLCLVPLCYGLSLPVHGDFEFADWIFQKCFHTHSFVTPAALVILSDHLSTVVQIGLHFIKRARGQLQYFCSNSCEAQKCSLANNFIPLPEKVWIFPTVGAWFSKLTNAM